MDKRQDADPGSPPTLTSIIEFVRGAARSGADPVEVFTPLQERLAALRPAFESFESQTYEGTAADGEIVAEVDGRGILLRIDIGPFAMRDLTATEIAGACADAIGVARSSLVEFMKSVRSELADSEAEDERFDDPKEILRQAMEVSGWRRST
jgi:DNA-binding protein YbaB